MKSFASNNIKTSSEEFKQSKNDIVNNNIYSRLKQNNNFYPENELKPEVFSFNEKEKKEEFVNNSHKRNIKETSVLNKDSLIFGNSMNSYNPKKLGKNKTFCYISNYPIITVGKEGKINNN